MKTILWYQDPENKSKDVISFNGEIVSPPSNPKYIEKYDFLYNLDKQKKRSTTESSIYKIANGYFIKGYFNEKDNLGRNTPFMFYSDTIDKEEFIKRLRDEANISEKTCPGYLIANILNFKERNDLLNRIIIGGVILVIIAILIAFINNK